MNNHPASTFFRVSGAANLGLHAMAVLAGAGDRVVRTREIAVGLKASASHLAKVMGALERAGLVLGTRGPSGGFRLARPAERVRLKEIYEAVEGPLLAGKCLFGVPACNGERCILGGFFGRVNRQVESKLTRTRLSEIALKIGVKHGKAKKDHPG